MTNIIFPTGVPNATPVSGDRFMFSDASDSNKLKDANLDDMPVSTALQAVIDDVAALPTASFTTISVSGQSNVVADAAADTLTLVGGTGVTITTNASGDSITFSAPDGAGDVI